MHVHTAAVMTMGIDPPRRVNLDPGFHRDEETITRSTLARSPSEMVLSAGFRNTQ